MVRLQTVISEMTGHQNNLACAGMVGLQMFFFFYLIFSSIFQIKDYVLLLRPKKGKVIYKRILTQASQCLQDISLNREVNFSSSAMFLTTIYNPNTNVTPFPHQTWVWASIPPSSLRGWKALCLWSPPQLALTFLTQLPCTPCFLFEPPSTRLIPSLKM